jgi:hypothetical protein
VPFDPDGDNIYEHLAWDRASIAGWLSVHTIMLFRLDDVGTAMFGRWGTGGGASPLTLPLLNTLDEDPLG